MLYRLMKMAVGRQKPRGGMVVVSTFPQSAHVWIVSAGVITSVVGSHQ